MLRDWAVPSAGTDNEVYVAKLNAAINEVLKTLADQAVQAALFVGKFWKQRVFDQVGETDEAGRRLALADARVVAASRGRQALEVEPVAFAPVHLEVVR